MNDDTKLPPAPAGYIKTSHVLAVIGVVATLGAVALRAGFEDRRKVLDKVDSLVAWTSRFEGYPHSAAALQSLVIQALAPQHAAIDAKLATLTESMARIQSEHVTTEPRLRALETARTEHDKRIQTLELAVARINDGLSMQAKAADSRHDLLMSRLADANASLKTISDSVIASQREGDKTHNRLLNLEVSVDELKTKKR